MQGLVEPVVLPVSLEDGPVKVQEGPARFYEADVHFDFVFHGIGLTNEAGWNPNR